jgi:reactive intermediate/imine deaminase
MVECVAQKNHHTDILHVQSISRWAPACIGPYSQAYTVGELVYLAGQIALDPPSMKISSTQLEDQLEVSIQNLSQVMVAMKSSPQKVLLCNVYLTSLEHQQMAYEQCKHLFDSKAILSFVTVKSLPRNAIIELQTINILKSSETKVILSNKGNKSIHVPDLLLQNFLLME